MLPVQYDIVTPDGPIERLPLKLEQTPSRGSTAILLLLLIPGLAAYAVPLSLLAFATAEPPAAKALLSEKPLVAAKLGLAFLAWTALFVVPLTGVARRLGRRRTISIDNGTVTVTERRLIGQRTWSEPIDAFRGLAHVVRTTLSGARHELILVHADPARSVLLHIAPRLSESAVSKARLALGVGEVPARELFRIPPKSEGLRGTPLAPATTG